MSAELTVPGPARSRILLEMASDLEALYEHYRRAGRDEEEAVRLAEERLLASPEALRVLVALHTTGYQRMVIRATGKLRWGFDALLFAVGVAPLLFASAYVTGSEVMAGGGGPIRWLILGIGAAVAGISAWKAYQFVRRPLRSITCLSSGLFTLLFLGTIAPIVGCVSFLFSLAKIGVAMSIGVPDDLSTAARTVAGSGTDFSLSILIAIAAALVWFVLVNRIGSIEREEGAALLEPVV